MSIQASYPGGGDSSLMFQNKSGKTIAPQGTTLELKASASGSYPASLLGSRREVFAFPAPSCWDLSLPLVFHQPASIPTLRKTA